MVLVSMPSVTQMGVDTYVSPSGIANSARYTPGSIDLAYTLLPGDTYKTELCSSIVSTFILIPVPVLTPVASFTRNTSTVVGSNDGRLVTVN